MGVFTNLTAKSLGVTNTFNWPWFVELCVCGILVLFFLFYFNRLFATIVSYFLRIYTWRQYRVWIDIQALQISLLGGRLFFKGLRYHGENETILVHSGHITWRYWLGVVRQADLTWPGDLGPDVNGLSARDKLGKNSLDSSENDEELGAVKSRGNAQARVAVFVSGVQWFVYNRTPLYDAILKESGAMDNEFDKGETDPSLKEPIKPTDKVRLPSILRRRQVASDSSSSRPSTAADSKVTPDVCSAYNGLPAASAGHSGSQTPVEVTFAHSLLIEALPVYIECSKAAVSIGNENTKALLVTTVERSKGYIDASGCGQHDLFRQLFDFEIEHPVVQMRPNPDYRSSQMDFAEHFVANGAQASAQRPWWKMRLHLGRRKDSFLSKFRMTLPWANASTSSLHHQQGHHHKRQANERFNKTHLDEKEWHGLTRYMDENEDDEHQAWADIEYARFSVILDCPAVHLRFYWDVPGRVCATHLQSHAEGQARDINGIAPPAYGLDLIVKGGSVNYGPWADRLRAELQAIFLPASYKSAVPASPLVAGDWRQVTRMVIRVEVEEEVTLRVPTRERSKDWLWRGRSTAVRDAATLRKQNERRHFLFRKGQKTVLGPDIRPFGWISFSVAADSSVRYEMDMVAGPEGYRNKLDLDLKETRASSSVNHALLWKCAAQKLACDLSNPLCWNGPHQWRFDIKSEAMDFYLLRDHMFLLTDLIADFTAGLKSDYMTFIPFQYDLRLEFNRLQLFLNANDLNIIDNPCESDSNAFLTLGIPTLEGIVTIPMHYFSPAQNSVLFTAHGSDLYLNLKTPIWNTLRNFSKHDVMATLGKLDLDGSYNYNTATSPSLTDSLLMNITGRNPVFHLEGFLIRYFMNVKENYFGDYLHYRTLEEYQSSIARDQQLPAEQDKSQAKKDNELDVILSVQAIDSCALMPANIYDRVESLRVDVMNIEADMRFTNYYMDLQVNSSPIESSIEVCKGDSRDEPETSSCQLFIDQVSVFGHRLFGAPPTEPTYVCNWDFDVGEVTGECTSDFLRITAAAIQSFIFAMDDDQNALKPTEVSVLPDVTFLRARTAGVRLWFLHEDTAFLAEIHPFSLAFDDWAGQIFSGQMKVVVPHVSVAAINLETIRQTSKNMGMKIPALACVETSISLAIINRHTEFEQRRNLQQLHVWFHDLRTFRAQCLLNLSKYPTNETEDTSWSQYPPNIPAPRLADPATNVPDEIFRSSKSSRARLPRKSSFLSIDSTNSRNSKSKDKTQQEKLSVQSNSHIDKDQAQLPPLSHAEIADSRSQHRTPAVTASLSSAWIPPYFPLQSVELDFDDMPRPAMPDQLQPANPGILDADDIIPQLDPAVAHQSIIIQLPRGIHGYCMSSISKSVVQFVGSILPASPADVMDSIERETVSNIQKMNFKTASKITDFAVHMPCLAFKLIDQQFAAEPEPHSRDQYTIGLVGAQLTLRTAPTATKQTQSRTKGDILLTQASVKRITLDVSENPSLTLPSCAGFNTAIEEVSLWLSIQDELRTNVQVADLKIVTGGSTVDRLSLLLQRFSKMIEMVVDDISKLDQDKHIQQLVHYLTSTQNNIANPAFLSRPSYVLRSAEDHVRLSNAWNALVILRHRLLALTPQQYAQLANPSFQEDVPPITHKALLNSLNPYYQDEFAYKSYRPFLVTIFGTSDDEKMSSSKVLNAELAVLIGGLSFVVDPGPMQSEIFINQCDLNIAQSPDFDTTKGNSLAAPNQHSKVVIQGWMAACTIDLNWELAQLIKSILAHVQQYPKKSDKTRPMTIRTDQQTSNLNLHVVVGTNNGLLRLKSPNLVVAMGAEDMKGSCTVAADDKTSTLTVLLASRAARMKLTHRDRELLQSKIKYPNVYIAHEPSLADGRDAIKLAASCKRLRFSMEEDPAGLLQAVKPILEDEMLVIRELMSLFNQEADIGLSSPKPAALNVPKLHLALFLSDYELKFALLPTVHYRMVGNIARTSIVPIAHSRLAVHVDVKKSNHMLWESDARLKNAKSVLHLPPIGGRVLLNFSEEVITVHARSVTEQINIEASAVYACFDAVFHPENCEYITYLQDTVQDLQKSLNALSSPSKIKEQIVPVGSARTRVSYNVYLVFAGLMIRCHAPVHEEDRNEAEMKFAIRHTTLSLQNGDSAYSRYDSTLQVQLNAPRIRLDLLQKTRLESQTVGSFDMGLRLVASIEPQDNGESIQNYRAFSNGISLDLSTKSPKTVVDMVIFLQNRIKAIAAAGEHANFKSLRRLKLARNETNSAGGVETKDFEKTHTEGSASALRNSAFIFDLNQIQARWVVDQDTLVSPGGVAEDLVFSIRKIDLRAQRESSASLAILDLQLQLVPKGQGKATDRTRNSALLPEVVFKAAHLSSKDNRRFAFQAAGKALDLRLAADGISPMVIIQKSLTVASAQFRGTEWNDTAAPTQSQPTFVSNMLGNKRLASLLVDADFAGAILSVTSRAETVQRSAFGLLKGPKKSRIGRYGQAVQSGSVEEAVLRAPGIALKVEYQDTGVSDPAFNMEVKVAASSNTLAPTVVPLMLDIYSSVREVIGDSEADVPKSDEKGSAQKYLTDAANPDTDPTAVLGRVRLNASLWVQRQEFSLTCQPVARVQATTSFDDIFVTVNTVQNEDQDRFFSILTRAVNLQASVQHIYSRESTASFAVESVVMSLMNSKHCNAKNGISAILNISPMKTNINARQLQDFLLFREIWYPKEIRRTSKSITPAPSLSDSQTYAMQRYQEFTATATLPWHAIISIQELTLQVDFGQALGKSTFTIAKLWASSKKESDLEQNLCVGFNRIGVDSTGRMSGLVELQGFRGRTSIKWPISDKSGVRAPHVQASLGFDHLRLKAAFDYQPFAVADVSSFEFLMYNVRPDQAGENDRLVGILDGGKVQAFVISAAGGQVLAIVQAFERLFQEKREAYESSLHEVERLLRRKSIFPAGEHLSVSTELDPKAAPALKPTYSLHTDVVVTLRSVDIGAFPNTFFDNQILKIDAENAQARFAVATVDKKIRSGLGMSLGQVRVALSAVGRSNTKALGEVEISDVIDRATSSKGGTILKVPRLVASMQTWQQEGSDLIEYIFRSTFQGKVDVGWNYSRISFIRGMWDTHSQALAQRLGKPLPPAAVKITADEATEGSGQEKITAVVNMPQSSKYEYLALEPPVIETPQLRDMGEATPPLEWIGLHRDKLPHVTHSIVIVTLSEVAKEVEEAYTRILGTG